MPSLAPVEVDGYVVRAGFLNDVPYFALGEGEVCFVEGTQKLVKAHKGGLLAAVESRDGKYLITSGDDGKVQKIIADGTVETLAERPRKWIDILASGPGDAVAFASGRTAWVRQADGSEKEFPENRAIGGLAFAPNGMKLAIARYDGVSVWFVNADTAPTEMEWAGAHLGVTYSDDGKYLVTTMQENALHGWRLSDSQDMRMSGYPAKVKSFSWSAKGRYLATSGAAAAICWPFYGKTGPMGQQPLQLGVRSDSLVSFVACHPKEDVVAVGYQDGVIMMCRLEDNAEVLLRRPGKGEITFMEWDAMGLRLVFGTEAGEAGTISLT